MNNKFQRAFSLNACFAEAVQKHNEKIIDFKTS